MPELEDMRPHDDTLRCVSVNSAGTCETSYLDHYRLLRKLGEGGMGVVYAAIDERLERKVAVKLLRERAQAVAKHRLIREAKALARVSHPNVVQIHDLGEFEGQTFIVMEYIDGVDLRWWLEAAKRTHAEILEVFIAAGHGLMAAHAHGVVHRDFKPANIMLGDDGRVRVVDFGLACSAGAVSEGAPTLDSSDSGQRLHAGVLTETGAVIGTPAYMAPEQLRGHEADLKTDQFSFCVALWEALYGARPFQARSMKRLLEAMDKAQLVDARDPEVRQRGVPDQIRRVLVRGLSADPDRRWSAFDALLGALSSPVQEKSRAWLGSVAVAAGLLIAGLGAGIAFNSATRQGPAQSQDQQADKRPVLVARELAASVETVATHDTNTEPATQLEAEPAGEAAALEASVPSPAATTVHANRHASQVAGDRRRAAPTIQIHTMSMVSSRCRSMLSCLRVHAVSRGPKPAIEQAAE